MRANENGIIIIFAAFVRRRCRRRNSVRSFCVRPPNSPVASKRLLLSLVGFHRLVTLPCLFLWCGQASWGGRNGGVKYGCDMKNYSVSVSNNRFTYLGNVRRQGGPHLTRNANMNLCYPSNGIITMTRGIPKGWYIGIIPSQNCPLFSCSMFKIPSRW